MARGPPHHRECRTAPAGAGASETRTQEGGTALRYLRLVETAHGSIGIAHTLPDYYTDWSTCEQAVRNGAARAVAHFEHAPSALLWSRPDVERKSRDSADLPDAMGAIGLVLIGHTPGPAPRWTRANVLCIDTGVHVHGHLTIAQIETGEPVLHRFARREPPAP